MAKPGVARGDQVRRLSDGGSERSFPHLAPGVLKAQTGEQNDAAIEPSVVLSSGLADFTRPDGDITSFG